MKFLKKMKIIKMIKEKVKRGKEKGEGKSGK